MIAHWDITAETLTTPLIPLDYLEAWLQHIQPDREAIIVIYRSESRSTAGRDMLLSYTKVTSVVGGLKD